MDWSNPSRRSFLKQLSAAGALAITSSAANAAPQAATAPDKPAPPDPYASTRTQRMAWWHRAKFGMFIHWGLYSVIGQHEWAKEVEGIPIPQYEILAKHFKPRPNAARDWARLA